tara:strand:- start:333 stop:752 length:420 start_codon:yes stop_codon:yes gene_type:complete
MTDEKLHGTPEIVANIAQESDNQAVKEKWEELNTLVHLVHKDKVIKKQAEATNLSKTWEEIDHRMRLVKNATRGTGLDLDTDDLDNWAPGVSYSFTNDDGTMGSVGHGTLSSDSFQLDLPIDNDDEKAKQQKDPKHNQW